MKDIRQRLLATFHGEHRDHVQHIRQTLATIDPAAPPGPELDDAFRRAHSLKGAARAVDLRQIEELAHRLETLFSRLRAGTMRLDPSVVAVIQRVLDASEDWLAASVGGATPAAPTEALDALARLLGMEGEAPKAAATATTPPPARPAAATVAVTASVTPAAQPPPVAPGAQPAPVAAMVPLAPPDTIRLDAESLDRLVTAAGQLATESLRQQPMTDDLRQISRQLAHAVAERGRARRVHRRVFHQLESSPEWAAASRYMNFVDHQIDRLLKDVSAAVRRQAGNAWSLQSAVGELQRDVQQARMVPAEDLFGGFAKMVRDLARDEGKAAALHVTGLQVRADRIVLQALKDPVMHMLRNAVSHGLETAADRTRAGKRPEGRIDLALEARGNRLLITIEDDGRGIDVGAVADTAVRKGLLDQTAVAARTPDELMRLILLPGFSTRRTVSEVSGRGMGLSVVAEALTRLQGTIDIGRSAAGGTRLSIAVPLSVSTHRLLLVTCAGRQYAVPVHSIERLHRIAVADLKTVASKPLVMLDGRAIPVVSLAQLLDAGEPTVKTSQNMLSVFIVHAGSQRVAVAVDAFAAEREAILKDLPAPANADARFAGGILLEDGSVCLVINPVEIVEGLRASADALVIGTGSEPAVDAERSTEILIVDDSVTTRTLEKSVLEAHGYQVSVAVDGVEALAHLRTEPVGLVITDVEMPRLDGFGLVAEMKRDPRLAQTPVIIVSSLESPEHQARGMALGADAYVVKRRFEQSELLDTIRQIL